MVHMLQVTFKMRGVVIKYCLYCWACESVVPEYSFYAPYIVIRLYDILHLGISAFTDHLHSYTHVIECLGV